jgi:hypothetical protein
MSEPAAPDECANCGAPIPPRARACPSCGADERTGWRENDATRYDGLDLPDSAFEDEPVARKFPRGGPRAGLPWYWIVAAGLIFVALILGLVRFR